MSKSEFDAFVQRQQVKQQEEEAFDPKQQLDQWLGYLDVLYKKISEYLQSYVDKETAKIEYRETSLSEEFIGSYVAREMLLRIGRSTVTFTPVGTMLIGMKGRVDVQGPRGSARLTLVSKGLVFPHQLVRVTVRRPEDPVPPPPSSDEIKEIEWTWKIMSPPPETKFIDLTQEEFFRMVLSVADA